MKYDCQKLTEALGQAVPLISQFDQDGSLISNISAKKKVVADIELIISPIMDSLNPYARYAKTAEILAPNMGEIVSITLPDFEDGNNFFVFCDRSHVCLGDVGGEIISDFSVEFPLNQIAIDSTSRQMLFATCEGTINLSDRVNNGFRDTLRFKNPYGKVALAMPEDPKRQTFLAGTDKGELGYFYSNGAPCRLVGNIGIPIHWISFLPDDKFVVASQNRIKIHDIGEMGMFVNRPIVTEVSYKYEDKITALTTNTQNMVVAGEKGIRLYDTMDLHREPEIILLKNPVIALCIDEKSKFICTGDRNGEINIYDLESRKAKKTFRNDGVAITNIAWDERSESIIAGDSGGRIKIYRKNDSE
ncbi:MAG: hypothetical protein NTW50_05265 [Candidatus Berkelbacteria bacterium]|nr:hypothetical protein [Candidatus Berkelbacteria bacterium]